ncbi:SDR family oxidoreductase [Candidatus Bealeia paramacronuclearis]|uniref:SDR family oxidoreductase n=1 Tax=Candidatus Bealeia paramacronuclearis TaxID=1921001 RepID=A0ABZ2C5M0_9PROT|nr:SDR family oxidoreductase [Candidatus Bealeia paramacronuclearis]
MGRLKNKIALITGAAQGIGASIAQLFVEEGAYVILSDILDDAGKKLTRELAPNATYFHLDVAQESGWAEISNFIESQFGKLDILVNNAGIMGFFPEFGPQDPEHASFKSWNYIHDVNLGGTFLGCKMAIPLMKEDGGSIVNMSSRSGLVGVPGAAAYASSKAAIRNHTKTVALYCAEKNYKIRCNGIYPAAILTSIWDPMLGATPEMRALSIEKIERAIPLGKMGEPLDVAYCALYLASDESKYVTGAELVIDGGILAGSSAAPKPQD